LYHCGELHNYDVDGQLGGKGGIVVVVFIVVFGFILGGDGIKRQHQ
jgi:hypothetical protein